jgi:Carbohydrate family 9 binding domain-like
MTLVPPSFLLRLSYPCRQHKEMPREDDRLLDLPPEYRLENFTALDGQPGFADVRLAWNDLGLGLQVEVKGKDNAPQGDADRPRASDGVTLWLDTRDARASHRASRYCHQFHLLPTGGGPDHDEPVFAQSTIHRALQDAPLCSPADVAFAAQRKKTGYIVEAFLPAAVLNGYDAEQNPRMGFFIAVRDSELGDHLLSATPEFPYWEDPSLWSVLELVKARSRAAK